MYLIPAQAPLPQLLRRNSKQRVQVPQKKSVFPPQDFVVFFAGLNVNMRLVTTIAQEMTMFYALCERYKEDFKPSKSLAVYSVKVKRMDAICAFTCPGHGTATTHGGDGDRTSTPDANGLEVDSKFLYALVNKMRAMRKFNVVHPPTGRLVTVSRMLERTQG